MDTVSSLPLFSFQISEATFFSAHCLIVCSNDSIRTVSIAFVLPQENKALLKKPHKYWNKLVSIYLCIYLLVFYFFHLVLYWHWSWACAELNTALYVLASLTLFYSYIMQCAGCRSRLLYVHCMADWYVMIKDSNTNPVTAWEGEVGGELFLKVLKSIKKHLERQIRKIWTFFPWSSTVTMVDGVFFRPFWAAVSDHLRFTTERT